MIWNNPLLSIEDRLELAIAEIERLHNQLIEARVLLSTRVEAKRLDDAMDKIKRLTKLIKQSNGSH